MQRIEFSELTNRLHRNLMLASALIIGISVFDIKVVRAAASGIELQNFTTRALITVLLTMLIYHALAFGIRAFEEYRMWEIQLAAKQAIYWNGGVGVEGLADKLKQVSDLLNKILANGGAIISQNQTVISQQDATQLKEAVAPAIVYGKRFANFPKITRIRFWLWDMGVAGLISAIALAFASFDLCYGPP